LAIGSRSPVGQAHQSRFFSWWRPQRSGWRYDQHDVGNKDFGTEEGPLVGVAFIGGHAEAHIVIDDPFRHARGTELSERRRE